VDNWWFLIPAGGTQLSISIQQNRIVRLFLQGNSKSQSYICVKQNIQQETSTKKSRVNHKVATLPVINKSSFQELEITIILTVVTFKNQVEALMEL